MKLSSKKNAAVKNAPAQNNAGAKFATAKRKPNSDNNIINEIDNLYQQINGRDISDNTEGLPEDEVTLEEIIAKGNLPDETFVIDYGSEDDVPPPTDSDYLEFHEPSEILETVINIDEVDPDKNFDLAGIPSKESADKNALKQDILPPKKNASGHSRALAASTTLADEHREAATPMTLLEPESEEDELYEAWREAEPLPLLDPETEDGESLWLEEEIAISPADDAVAESPKKASLPDAFTDSSAKLTGARCIFCNHPLSHGDKMCRNCAAPVNPKRMFHDWAHTYSEPGAASQNLVSCRFCGHMVYRRAHECPKCHNTLLKPVYAPEEIKVTSRAVKKPIKSKSGRFQYLALICLAIAIAALIVSKALTQSP